jgi:hypothetical protein
MDNVKLADEFDQFQHTPETAPQLKLWASVAEVGVSDAKRGHRPAMYWIAESQLFDDICSWLCLDVELARNAVLPDNFQRSLHRERSKHATLIAPTVWQDYDVSGLYPFEVEFIQRLNTMTLDEIEAHGLRAAIEDDIREFGYGIPRHKEHKPVQQPIELIHNLKFDSRSIGHD